MAIAPTEKPSRTPWRCTICTPPPRLPTISRHDNRWPTTFHESSGSPPECDCARIESEHGDASVSLPTIDHTSTSRLLDSTLGGIFPLWH